MKYSAFLLFQFLFFLNCNLLAADSPSMSHMQMNHEHVDKGVFMLSVGHNIRFDSGFLGFVFYFFAQTFNHQGKIKGNI